MKPRSGYMKGQIGVVMTFAIATLLGAMALGTDVAVMYFNWVQLQKAADAAALAGASYLGNGSTNGNSSTYRFKQSDIATGCSYSNTYNNDAKVAACSYASKNGMSTTEIKVNEPGQNLPPTAPTPNLQVSIVRNNLPYFFGKVLGLNTYSVAAVATAKKAGPVGTVLGGLFPAGLQCNTDASGNCFPTLPNSYSFGQSILLGQGPTGGFFSPGNWGWLDPSNSSGNSLRNDIANGVGTSVNLNELVSVVSQPGNQNGNVKSGFKTRISNQTSFVASNTQCRYSYSNVCSTTSPVTPCSGDPFAVVVPIVNFNNVGKSSVPVAGFAELYLDSGTNPNSGNIHACFIKIVTPDSISTSGAPNLGATAPPTLIQ
jgi:Putative Flp pilus-assembly TadE/G-like